VKIQPQWVARPGKQTNKNIPLCLTELSFGGNLTATKKPYCKEA
jgi:hypothetical protein